MTRKTAVRSFLQSLVMGLAFMALAACGGGGGGNPDPVPLTGQQPEIVKQPESKSVPNGSIVTFDVSSKNSDGATVRWLRNGQPYLVSPSHTLIVGPVARVDNGSRWVAEVSNTAGVTKSAEAVLSVDAVPVGIELVTRDISSPVLAVGVDPQGNSILVSGSDPRLGTSFPAGSPTVVLRKFGLDGSPAAFGATGQGVFLPLAFGPDRTEVMTGFAADGAGNFFLSLATMRGTTELIPNAGRIVKVGADGQVSTLVEWPAGSLIRVAPSAVAVGPSGALYFVDTLTGDLVRWTTAAGASVVVPKAVPLRSESSMPPPEYIAVDAQENIYVLATNILFKVQDNRLVQITGGKSTAGVFDQFTFSVPSALAVGPGGDLFVADLTVIYKVTPAGAVTLVAGTRNSNGLQPGPLPGSLGVAIRANARNMAVDRNGVIHLASIFAQSFAFPDPEALVRIRLPQ